MNVLLIFVVGAVVLVGGLRFLRPIRSIIGANAAFGLELVLAFLIPAAALWLECSLWALIASTISVVAAYRWVSPSVLQKASDLLGRYRLPLYLLSVFGIALLVLVAIPVTTFLTSPGEIGIHFDRLLKVNMRNVMVVVYSAAILYMIAYYSEIRSGMTLLSIGAFFLSWIYAFVLPFGFPMLTGLAFEQLQRTLASTSLRTLIDLLVVVSIGLTLRLFWKRFGTRAILGAMLIANFSILLAAGISINRDQVGMSGGGEPASMSEKTLQFSRSHPNTLFIFLDRFMGSHVESILESHPDLAQRLSGFIWYPRTVSAGQNSIAGLHPLLGGYDYTPVEMNRRGMPLRDLAVEAFSILPRSFADKGYRVNFVNPRGLGFTMQGDCDFLRFDGVTCTHIPASISHQKAKAMGFPINALAEANYADLLVLLGAMRVAPYAMKEAIYVNGPWKPFLDHSAGTTFREWAELEAMDQMTEIDEFGPSFNFISNILPHEPYFMGLDCLPKPEALTLSKDELKSHGHGSLFSLQHANTARCALLSVARFFDYMKAEGVYDNTTIVIASDHGIVGSVQDSSRRAVEGGATDNAYVSLRPLVMLKRAGGSGLLKVSEDFMPNAEVPSSLCKDIGGCVNPYLNKKSVEAMGRDDPFFASFVPWQFSMQKPNSFVITKQLVLKGKDPFDIRGWSTREP